VTDEDRAEIKNLLRQLVDLLKGFKLETRGIRQHVSTVADLSEQTFKDCLRTLQKIDSKL
jgi:hypothetical protein